MATTIYPPVHSPAEIGMKNRTIELDFARGLAVLLVMGYHFRALPTHFAPYNVLNTSLKHFGATGVDMFFVLSGFLVGGLLLQEYRKRGSVRVGRFLTRRALKIFPAYYAYLLFQVVSRHFPFRSYFFQNLFQLQNYTGSPLSHTWTVALEVHFYLALALVMGFLASRKASPKVLFFTFLGMALASFLSRVITIALGHPNEAIFLTHNRLDSLLCGVLLGVLACFYPLTFEKLSDRMWPLLAIMAFLVFYLVRIYPATMEAPAPGWGYFGAAILYLGFSATLLFLLRYSGPVRDMFWYRAAAWVGTYSYGIYLWHNAVRQPMVSIAGHVPHLVRWPFLFFGQYVAAIVLGVLMTRIVEWPVLRYRERVVPAKEVKQIDDLVRNETHPRGTPAEANAFQQACPVTAPVQER